VSQPIEIGGFLYEQQNGAWVFKAKESEPFQPSGVLKPKYKELPQFPVIYDIEAHHRGQMNNEIKTATQEILDILKP